LTPALEQTLSTQSETVNRLANENTELKKQLTQLQETVKPFAEVYKAIVQVFGEKEGLRTVEGDLTLLTKHTFSQVLTAHTVH